MATGADAALAIRGSRSPSTDPIERSIISTMQTCHGSRGRDPSRSPLALLPPGNVLLSFAPVDHESVVIAVESPRTRRNFGGLYKPPIRCVRRFQTKIIPHCR